MSQAGGLCYSVGILRGSGPFTLAGWTYRLMKILALKLPTARRAALYLFSVSLTSFDVVEEDPLVLTSDPPELPPEFVPPRAQTIELGHRLPLSAGIREG